MAVARRPSWKFTPPMVLFALALAIGAVSALSGLANPYAVAKPIGFGTGQTETIVFRPALSGRYELGVEMDLAMAEQLYPCVVEVGLGGNQTPCRNDNTAMDMPVELAITLQAQGETPRRRAYSAKGERGGSYGGDAYTLRLGNVSLTAGRQYRLTVTSLRDATTLEPARPRLVVYVHPIDMTGRLLLRLLGYTVAAGLAVIGGLWLVLAQAFRWRRARRARPSAS